MYLLIVAAFMLVLPLASLLVDAFVSAAAVGPALVVKWFAFWSVGWRLSLAGIRQIVQPRFTAQVIFGLTAEEPLILVRELGFANVAIGLLGLVSLWRPAWQLAAALTGGIFYALAGISHAFHAHRTRMESIAMVSDLGIAAVLLGAGALSFEHASA